VNDHATARGFRPGWGRYTQRKVRIMYARVVRFSGADADAIEANVVAISANPEHARGVTATRFLFLTDKANGTVVAISFHQTEEAMRAADAVLTEMSPDQPMGTRESVDMTEVALDLTPA
jgi:hypothetical protein